MGTGFGGYGGDVADAEKGGAGKGEVGKEEGAS